VKEKSVKEMGDELVIHQQMWPKIYKSFYLFMVISSRRQ
jgi:hypothetical protein